MHLRNSTSHFGAPGPKSPARRLSRLIEDFRVVPGKYQDNTSSTFLRFLYSLIIIPFAAL
jgi:hypothetical protein